MRVVAAMDKKERDRRQALLPDAGAMKDEHGRPPGVPSRTGTGSGPVADPARVERSRKEGKREREPGGRRAEQ